MLRLEAKDIRWSKVKYLRFTRSEMHTVCNKSIDIQLIVNVKIDTFEV